MAIKNWLIRGDTHGQFQWMTNGCLDKYKPEETAIIILGDAGFNFYLNKNDEKLKREVNNKGYIFYCVHGNHEARPQDIKNMELIYDEEIHGNIYMQSEFPNIHYFMDYGIYKINRYNVAVIGGAYSVDKWYRLSRFGIRSKLDADYINSKKTGWFPNEQLSTKEMLQCFDLLKDKKYDFIFSHTCPYSWRPTDLFLSGINQDEVDTSMEKFLEDIKNNCTYYVWCWGHYHADRIERPHAEMYYNDIEDLNTIQFRWARYDETGDIDWWLNKSPNFYINS